MFGLVAGESYRLCPKNRYERTWRVQCVSTLCVQDFLSDDALLPLGSTSGKYVKSTLLETVIALLSLRLVLRGCWEYACQTTSALDLCGFGK